MSRMFSTKRERESFPTLQSAEPVAIESLNQIARSLVRSSHTTVRAHSQGENNQTNERASARPSALRPSALRPSVRPSRSKPTHEGTNRVEFRVARARSVRRLVDDRAIDRSKTTETRDGNPRRKPARHRARVDVCPTRATAPVRACRSAFYSLFTHTTHTVSFPLPVILSNHEPSITPIYVYTRAQPDVRLSVGANPTRPSIERFRGSTRDG